MFLPKFGGILSPIIIISSEEKGISSEVIPISSEIMGINSPFEILLEKHEK